MLKGRTPGELERKRKKLLKIKRALSLFAVLAGIGLLGLLGYSVYAQYIYDPYANLKIPPGYPTSWGGGVYRIQVFEGEKVFHGTGFSIGPQLVITNAHVVKKKDTIVKLFTDSSKEVVRGQVIWVGEYSGSPLQDLAIINLGKTQERSGEYVLPLCRGADLADQEEVIALGFHMDHTNLSIQPGNITSLTRPDKLVQHSAAINMGFSGGPLISKKRKQVVGIVVAEEDRAVEGRVVTGIKLAIPVNAALANIPAMYLPHITTK